MDEPRDETQAQGVPPLLRDPLGLIRRRWQWMLPALVVSLAASLVWVLIQPVFYRARATVVLASQKLAEDFVRPTIEEDPLERVNALIAEALSRQNLSKIVEKRGLYPTVVRERGITDAVALLRSMIKVELDKGVVGAARQERARILVVFYFDPDPTQAAEVLNEVVALFPTAGERLRAQQTRLTTEFMRREMEGAEKALREVDDEIRRFHERYRGELPSELEPNMRRLERLQAQSTSLAMQIAGAETRLAALVASGAAPSSPAAQLQDLRATLARELAVNTETHPNVISLRRQIALLEKELRGEGGSGVHGILVGAGNREITRLREQLEETDREITELDKRVAAIPARQQELTALAERAAVLRENYIGFMRKLKDAELAASLDQAQQGDRVAVLDSAFPPTAPENTPWKFGALGVMASFGLAAVVGLILEARDPALTDREGLEALGVPSLGTVPRIG